jgi:putative transposase
MNPAASGLVAHSNDYPWSSARAHLAGQGDQLTKVEPLLDLVNSRNEFLVLAAEENLAALRKHDRSCRPLGQVSFVEHLEENLA